MGGRGAIFPDPEFRPAGPSTWVIVAIAGVAIRILLKGAMICIIFVAPTIRAVYSQTMLGIDGISTTPII
eukprot:7648655-Pyramimonas_sp.AAC.1